MPPTAFWQCNATSIKRTELCRLLEEEVHRRTTIPTFTTVFVRDRRIIDFVARRLVTSGLFPSTA